MVTILRRNPNRVLTAVEPIHYHPYSFDDEIEMLARDFWDEWEPEDTEGLPMEMFERKDDLITRIELPGVKREDIDISLDGTLLTIKAEKKEPGGAGEDSTSYFCERCYGNYTRSVTLPFPVDATKVSTSFENGLLEIRLPKAEEAKTKHIAIKVGSSPKALTSESK